MSESGRQDIRVLLVEDSPADAELIVRELQQGGYDVDWLRVETAGEMTAVLDEREFDLVILDFNLPRFDAHAALTILAETGKDIPAFVVSGSVGEELAVETMRSGATDYIMKDNLVRLVPAVERELRDAAIRHSRARVEADLNVLAHAIESAAIGITIGSATEPGNPLVRVNPAFMRMTGYTESDLIGRSCNLLQGPETSEETTENIRVALAAGRQFNGTILNYRKDGSTFWNNLTIAPVRDKHDRLTHFVGLQVDITSQRQIEERLAWVMSHDQLTDLGNRRALEQEVDARLVVAQAGESGMTGVIAIDIDRFGQLNDSLGREVADEILIEVSRRVQAAVPRGSVLARTGADEFAMALVNLGGITDLERVAETLLAVVETPMSIDGVKEPLVITASLGLALDEDGRIDGSDLIKNANAAMQRSKRQGRSGYQVYSREMTQGAARLLVLEGALRGAIRNDELTLHYQPQLDLGDEAVGCVEALVRWQHPEHGLVSPADFIPLAEETGLIVPLGDWVMREALRQIRAWEDDGGPSVRVAVNLSVQQLDTGALDAVVSDLLTEFGLEAERLELEITESQLMNNLESKRSMLANLDELGVTISIDDFGTGYSSLAYLRRLPIDVLKIDRSFVRDIGRDESADKIVVAVNGLAHGLGMKVVAEGVETQAQRDFLTLVGCDTIQGYLFSKPLPADEVRAFLLDLETG